MRDRASGLISEFNMSQLTMDKIHRLQIDADRYSVECSNLQLRYLTYYFTSLEAIYRYIRPLLIKKLSEEYDKRFNDISDNLYKRMKFEWKTYTTIKMLHRDMIQVMQERNLVWSAMREQRYAENDLKPEYRIS